MKDSMRQSPRDTPRQSARQSARQSGAFGRTSEAADEQARTSQTLESYPLRPYNPQVDGENNDTRPNSHATRPRDGNHTKRKKSSSPMKDHFIAAVGEFIGTVLFLWFAFAWHMTAANRATTVALSDGQQGADTILFISIAYGFSLLVCAWAFYRVSGGLYNPAVTLGMVITGNLPWLRGVILFPAQILGAIVAAALVECMFPGKIGTVNTKLSPGVSIAQGVFIEMFLTTILVFSILMLAAEKSKVTFMAPLGIGLALFVAELAGVAYTGGSLNPARTFGPAVVSHTWVGYQWIYWVGPFLGSLATAGLYWFLKLFNYEEANPGQDSANGDFDQA